MSASELEIVICPNCHAENFARQSQRTPTFCSGCRFPLVLVANKYRLIREIGRGGFGTVYEARHIYLAREESRVVKVLRPELLDDEAVRHRFLREIQVTSTLSQRNHHIVRIFDDFGEIEGLGFFYVMEYLEGQPLSDLLKDTKETGTYLPLQRCYHIFDQMCTAMEAAHQEGIVHRDLKPSNLLVGRHLQDPYFVKVIDFGIAKALESSAESAQLTQGVLGTPAYMSPEQCMNENVGPATDIYAMGIILFELLGGATPFMTAGHTARSAAELITAHLTQIPPRLHDILPPERQVPRALSDLLEKTLQKDLSARFASVRELQEAFHQAIHPNRDTQSLRPFSEEEEATERLGRETSSLRPLRDQLPTARSLGDKRKTVPVMGHVSEPLPDASLISPGEAPTIGADLVEVDYGMESQRGTKTSPNRTAKAFEETINADLLLEQTPPRPQPKPSSALPQTQKSFPQLSEASGNTQDAMDSPPTPPASRKGLFAFVGLGCFLAIGAAAWWQYSLTEPNTSTHNTKTTNSPRPMQRSVATPPKTQDSQAQPIAAPTPTGTTDPSDDQQSEVVSSTVKPSPRRVVPRKRRRKRRSTRRRRTRPHRPVRTAPIAPHPARTTPIATPPAIQAPTADRWGCPIWAGLYQAFLRFREATPADIRVSFSQGSGRKRRTSKGYCIGVSSPRTRITLNGARHVEYVPCLFRLQSRVRRVSPQGNVELRIRLQVKQEGMPEPDSGSYCVEK